MAPKVAKRITSSTESATEKQKSTWTSSETETLVHEFIARKSVLLGAFSSTITKQDKYRAWDEIQASIKLDSPSGDIKTTAQVKKKWENLMKYSKIEIARYNSAMRGTGGGPEYIWKNVLFKDIYEKVIGVGNPSIPGGQIEGGLDSEMSDLVSNTPPATNVHVDDDYDGEDVIEDEASNELAVITGDDGVVSIVIDSPDLEPRSSSTPVSGRVSSAKTSSLFNGKSVRQMMSKTKRIMCEDSIVSSGKRALRDRLELLDVILRVRKNMGNPVVTEEVPQDLMDAIHDIKNVC